MKKNSFVFFGTPDVARHTLCTLLNAGYIPSLVVTNPDAPKGRGMTLTPSPVRTLADEHNIPIYTPNTLDSNAIRNICSINADFALVVAYGKIFPLELIDLFPLGVLNVHYSLLPKYRGAIPTEAAILHGETVTGVTIQKMIQKLDAGEILSQVEVSINTEDTARELRPRLIKAGADLLINTLPSFINGTVKYKQQDESLATHYGKLKKEDGLIDLNGIHEDNWNKYRAYADSIGTYYMRDGKRVKIRKAIYKDGQFMPVLIVPEGKPPIAYKEFLS